MDKCFNDSNLTQNPSSFEEMYTDFDSWICKVDRCIKKRSNYLTEVINNDEEILNDVHILLLQRIQKRAKIEFLSKPKDCDLSHVDHVYYRLLISDKYLQNIRSKL